MSNDKHAAHGDDTGAVSPQADTTFEAVLRSRMSRRTLLKGSFGMAAAGFFGAGFAPAAIAGKMDGKKDGKKDVRLGFRAAPKSLADALVIAPGYTATVFYRTGDPIAPGVPEYRNDGSEPAESFLQRAGDHHDGMHYFGLGKDGRRDPSSSTRGLLCMNHEYVTANYLHPNGRTVVDGVRTVPGEVLKEMLAHGVSIVEVEREKGRMSVRKDSRFNRRITALTEMALSGPAGRSRYMVTAFSKDGSRTRGTVNNCANGHTPWGTYLTCEENWGGYFRRLADEDDPKRSAKERTALARYDIAGRGTLLWATAAPSAPDDTRFARWNAMRLGGSQDGSDDFRNAPNTFGWVVEIDPFAPASMPKKRTALGRFMHEGAWPSRAEPGKRLAWYMGCDSRHEYIFKYVSDAPWDPADAGKGLAAGDKYLDHGRLYAAKFHADGTGQWIELSIGRNGITADYPAYPFADQADVVVHALLAADAAGATRMDRPEWAAVNPANGDVYVTLTNSSADKRVLESTDAANPRFYSDPPGKEKAYAGNPNGHIIRWAEEGGDPGATAFRWDVFAFGARASADPDNVNLSQLTDDNDFSSPDTVWFSHSTGLLWFHTDDAAMADLSNPMVLAAVPGSVGDGGSRTVRNRRGSDEREVETQVGAPPGDRLRRFLIGPRECEITGCAETPDGRTLFINIQHPGVRTVPDYANPKSFGSHWPEGGDARPRSATIVITRDDGGRIGIEGD